MLHSLTMCPIFYDYYDLTVAAADVLLYSWLVEYAVYLLSDTKLFLGLPRSFNPSLKHVQYVYCCYYYITLTRI